MRFSKQDAKMREHDRLLKRINDVGGMDELVRFIRESQNGTGYVQQARQGGQSNMMATTNFSGAGDCLQTIQSAVPINNADGSFAQR